MGAHLYGLGGKGLILYTHKSPENVHKLMGFYMEVVILGAILQYMLFASLMLGV